MEVGNGLDHTCLEGALEHIDHIGTHDDHD
jgi:hypothetical protein